jgi:hypothetical protein
MSVVHKAGRCNIHFCDVETTIHTSLTTADEDICAYSTLAQPFGYGMRCAHEAIGGALSL